MTQRRYIEKDKVYFVTALIKDRKPVLTVPSNSNLLLATIEYFRYYLDYSVYGYVIMPEHFHLLVLPSLKYDISKIMNCIKGNFARRYNQINNCIGDQVWQQGFYDKMVRDRQDLMNKIEYMHNNPVKAGLADKSGDYPFSSYHQYYGKVRNAVQVMIRPSDLL